MTRPTMGRERPHLSLTPELLTRARAYLLAHPGAHGSLSALVDAALLAFLDAAGAPAGKPRRPGR